MSDGSLTTLILFNVNDVQLLEILLQAVVTWVVSRLFIFLLGEISS